MTRNKSKPMLTCALAAALALAAATVLQAANPAARVNAPAPEFSAFDSHGNTQNLSGYKGKIVVLEWTNNGCPFVGKHYGSGNMQSLQKKYTSEGVVWFTIVSSAPGTQGYVTAEEANRDTERRGAHRSLAGPGRHPRPFVRRAGHSAHVCDRRARSTGVHGRNR